MNSDRDNIPQVTPLRNHTSLAQMAYESIRAAILSGRIKPGERLGQVELARDLGVSERTVREALARLAAKGLAVHEPYKGLRVVAMPLEDLREVYTLRAILEGRAMEMAAARITPEEIARMHDLLPHTIAQAPGSSVHSAQQANHDFHWIAIHASGSNILVRMLEHLWELMYAYDLLYQNEGEKQRTSDTDLAQHEALLSALETRNGPLAAQINTEHITTSMDILLAQLDHLTPEE